MLTDCTRLSSPPPPCPQTRRLPTAERLGDVLRLPGERLRFSYDWGDTSCVDIEVGGFAAHCLPVRLPADVGTGGAA